MNVRDMLVWKTDNRSNNPSDRSVLYDISSPISNDSIGNLNYDELCVLHKLIGEFVEEGKGGKA